MLSNHRPRAGWADARVMHLMAVLAVGALTMPAARPDEMSITFQDRYVNPGQTTGFTVDLDTTGNLDEVIGADFILSSNKPAAMGPFTDWTCFSDGSTFTDGFWYNKPVLQDVINSTGANILAVPPGIVEGNDKIARYSFDVNPLAEFGTFSYEGFPPAQLPSYTTFSGAVYPQVSGDSFTVVPSIDDFAAQMQGPGVPADDQRYNLEGASDPTGDCSLADVAVWQRMYES